MTTDTSEATGTGEWPARADRPVSGEPLEDGVVTSARDRKKRETRIRIHRAAVRLAVERGLPAVTVEEVAIQAGVSPRTFFNYFLTKEDALVGADPGRPDALRDAVLDRPAAETPGRAIRAVLTDHVLALAADADLWRMRRELASRNPELAARIAGAGDRIETALVDAAYTRAGTDPADDLAPGLTARVAMAAVRAAFHQHRVAGLDGSLAQRLDDAFDAVGVGTDDDAAVDPYR